MRTIDLNTWETIKLIPEIWKPHGYIKPEEKDLGVLIIGQQVILPKFFVERNKEYLRLYAQTSHLCEPIETYQGHPLTKFETNISPRDEQVIIMETIENKVSQNLPVYGQVVATPGFGKEQCYSEPVLTPNGWTTMGELKIGSNVVGKDGKPTKVTHIHEHGQKDVYKISFQDGTYTRCGLDHLWYVKNRNKLKNKNKGWETVDTCTLLKNFKSGKHNIFQQYRYEVPLCESIKYNNSTELKISSYAMGLILSNGDLSQLNIAGNSIITYADNKTTIHKLINELLKVDPDLTYNQHGVNYSIKSHIIRDIMISYKLAGLKSVEKFIPDDYLTHDTRDDLLKAFLETDSFSHTKFSKMIYSSSKIMIRQLYELCQSLGIYTNKIQTNLEPKFTSGEQRVDQMAYQFLININPKKNTKTIVNVELLDYQENSRCITVDAKDHLYITRDFTVTHNSIIAIKACEILKQKTLIIVPNDILNEQFIGSIVEFSNLEKEDIGLLQGSDLDHILKQGHFDKDIVIAKIQSLYSQFKKYTIESLRELYKVFGLVIYDEAHVGTASDGYSLTVNMFKTNNIISMTATPFRNGINDFIFQNMTGGILYESTHQNLVPDIMMHCFQTVLSTSEIQKLQYFMGDYTMFMTVLNSILFNKDEYFDWIAQWVQYRYHEGHSIAVLFSTNAMVGKLHDKLVALGLPAGKITGKTDKKGKKVIEYITYDDVTLIYDETIKRNPRKKKVVEIKLLKGFDDKYQVTSSTRKLITDSFPEITIKQTLPELSERDQVKELPILVSNFKFLSAGYDKSELSCVIFGSLVIGKIPVNQTLGRIARVNKNKRQDIVAHFMVPDIYDKLFPDNIFTLVNNIKKRYPSNFRYEGFDWERKKKK